MAGATIRKWARRAGVLIERANLLTMPTARLVEELRRRDVDLILDIGANDGGYGREVYGAGYSGEMISFEPLPGARHKLQQTVATVSGWSVGPAVALSDSEGVVTFHEAGNSASSSLLAMNDAHVQAAPESATARTIQVFTKPLDLVAEALGCDRPHFMKIDVQGAESMVLAGARNTLGQTVGLQIEMSLLPLYEGQVLWRDLDATLTGLGFRLWDIIPGFRHRQTGQLMQFDGVYFRN